jgi:predicted MFS family arabinose efflux permease
MTPDSLQGRITSIMVVSSRAAAPLGAIIGGLVGQQVGLRESLLISSAGMGAAVFWLLYYRTWSLREMPGLGDA